MNNFVGEIQNKYQFFENYLKNSLKPWTKFSSGINLQFRNIKWKNAKAKPGCAYKPTAVEQFANVITHGIWIIPAVVAACTLFQRSKTTNQFVVSWVYGGTLSMLFVVSTFFHCSCYCANQNALKNVLHRSDRAMIYVFIAGSYFPWLHLDHAQGILLFYLEWIIWILAIIGIAYQQLFHERFKSLETFFYLLMGLGPALLVILTGYEFNGLIELKLGGFFYILGVGFFKSDGYIPLAHAIWHLFVVLAAGFHYYAILVNLYPAEPVALGS